MVWMVPAARDASTERREMLLGDLIPSPGTRSPDDGRSVTLAQLSAHHTRRGVLAPLPLTLTDTEASAPTGMGYVLVLEPVPLLPVAVQVVPTAAPLTRSVQVVVPDPPALWRQVKVVNDNALGTRNCTFASVVLVVLR